MITAVTQWPGYCLNDDGLDHQMTCTCTLSKWQGIQTLYGSDDLFRYISKNSINATTQVYIMINWLFFWLTMGLHVTVHFDISRSKQSQLLGSLPKDATIDLGACYIITITLKG
jgi:hypothetical protein